MRREKNKESTVDQTEAKSGRDAESDEIEVFVDITLSTFNFNI